MTDATTQLTLERTMIEGVLLTQDMDFKSGDQIAGFLLGHLAKHGFRVIGPLMADACLVGALGLETWKARVNEEPEPAAWGNLTMGQVERAIALLREYAP